MTITLRAEGIRKHFGATLANDNVDLELRGGEVHALLGQNGAGKSTLVGIITGRLAPDSGRVLLNDAEVPLWNPRAASQLGIATVFQELMLIPSMTGLENIALALGESAGRAVRSRVDEVQREFELPSRLDTPVRDLEMPERQRIELVRALCQRPSVLLLDEPTSLLSITAVPAFLAKARELADSGIALLLITHRLDEARTIADRLTVMRQGRVIAHYDRSQVPSNSELAMEMLGVELAEEHHVLTKPERPAVEVTGLVALDDRKHRAVDAVSLTLGEGEVLGLAGVDGNGQLELLEALAGLRRGHGGTIVWNGQDVTSMSYDERFRRGIHFVSGDRQRNGIIPTFTIADHFEYAIGRAILPRLPEILSAYGVRPPDPGYRADQLSGGNQQKMLVATACERDARILLLSYPTRGLDVQASLNLRDILIERAQEHGVTIVVSSSDLDELLLISHRIAVMSRGRIAGIQSRADGYNAQQLAEWFSLTGDAEVTGSAIAS